MKKSWILMLIGLLAGMATCNLIPTRKKTDSNFSTEHIPVAGINKQMQQQEKKYMQEKLLLGKQVVGLQDAYQLITEKINLVKKENQQLRQQVSKTIYLLNNTTDTVSYLQGCDTLVAQVANLSSGYEKQDTLAAVAINNLEEQLLVKDQLIVSIDKRRETVQDWLNKSLAQNNLLEKEVGSLQKKTKRQRLKGTIKTICITAAAWWLGKNL